jgi:hypothetical protein
VPQGAGLPVGGHHAEPAEKDGRVRVRSVDLDDAGVGPEPLRDHDHHHPEQEDQVDDEPAQLPGGQADERGPTDDRPDRRNHGGHDETSTVDPDSAAPPRNNR